jgi:hypothetical protein
VVKAEEPIAHTAAGTEKEDEDEEKLSFDEMQDAARCFTF